MSDFERCPSCPAREGCGAGEVNEAYINAVVISAETLYSPNDSKKLAQDTYMRFRYTGQQDIEPEIDDELEKLKNSADCFLRNQYGECIQFLMNEANIIKEQA